jgi:SAM-dependent MidA family methyltransferase
MMAAGWDVGWGSNLQEACTGTRPVVVVGNEFLDAVPVHVIDVGGDSVCESYVTVAGTGLEQTWGEVSDSAAAEMGLLLGTLDPKRPRSLRQTASRGLSWSGRPDATGGRSDALRELRQRRL